MKLFFIRHGESIANTEGIISNRDLPHPLTDKGRRQAQTLAQKLQPESITKIFASPILGARETAEILARTLNAPLEIADALREFDCGALEGKSYFEHANDFEQLFRDWKDSQPASCFAGGESLLDLRARFVPFIEKVIREMNSVDQIALVSHGGLLSGALPYVLKNIDHPFAFSRLMDNTAFVVAESTPDGLICRSWCDQKL